MAASETFNISEKPKLTPSIIQYHTGSGNRTIAELDQAPSSPDCIVYLCLGFMLFPQPQWPSYKKKRAVACN